MDTKLVKNPRTSWDTEREIEFIKNLGKHCVNPRFHDLTIKQNSKAELLAGYLAGALKRENWCDIDSAAVIKYARSL